MQTCIHVAEKNPSQCPVSKLFFFFTIIRRRIRTNADYQLSLFIYLCTIIIHLTELTLSVGCRDRWRHWYKYKNGGERAVANVIGADRGACIVDHPWQAADKLRTDGREHQSRGQSRIRASPFGRQTSISDMAKMSRCKFFCCCSSCVPKELRKIVWGE
jgi:hypothetical protein